MTVERFPMRHVVDPVAAFRERAAARAYLWHAGQLTLCEAVDELQETAERDDLVEQIGQDAVQAIIAGAFAPYRQMGEPLPVPPEIAKENNGCGVATVATTQAEEVGEDERPPTADLLADAIEHTRLQRTTGSSRAEQQVDVFDAQALNRMTFDPIKYVVPGYVVEGLTLFAGKPKIGKSWLLLHAAFAVADGGLTLGNVQCEQGDVLYCALEDNQRRLQSRITKLFGANNWPAGLKFTCGMPRLTEGGLEFIKTWIEHAVRPRLVIIDTLAMVRPPNRKEQGTYDADYAAVKDLRDIALKYGIAIVLVHHLRKADADDAFDTVSGTLGLTGAPDSIMILRRDTRGTTLHARGRDITEIEKAIRFDVGTCTWVVLGEASTIRKSAERTAIVKALEEAGGESLTPNQLAGACGMKPANVRFLLAKLLAEDVVEKATYGKYILAKAAQQQAAE